MNLKAIAFTAALAAPAALAAYDVLVPECDKAHAAVEAGNTGYFNLLVASHCDPEGKHKGMGAGLFRQSDQLMERAQGFDWK